MRRKVISILLTVLMVTGSLSGCQKPAVEESGSAKETEESTVDGAENPAETKVVDMTDPTPGDYGKLYYASVDEKHVAEEDSVMFIDNEILIVAKEGVSEAQVESIADKYKCEIVGEIEVTGDYQLRLSEVMTKEELESTVENLEAEDVIVSASLNYVAEVSPTETDGHVGFKYGEKWKNDLQDYTDLEGNSWGLEAINTIQAWEELTKHKEQVNPVRVGLIDNGLYNNYHVDLKYAGLFYDAGGINNVESTTAPTHGLHVSGIMAANSENKEGICGVYPYGNGNLYGVDTTGVRGWVEETDERDENGNKIYISHVNYTENYSSIMFEKIAYSELIVRNVKVINQSQGFNWHQSDTFQKKNNQGENYIDYAALKEWWDDPSNHTGRIETAKELGSFFQRLIRKGYDFVIVAAAGNDSYPSIGHLEAVYASWNTLIFGLNYPDVYDRIIVVGSVSQDMEISWFSNGGNRVDIYAPGEAIYSTCNDDYSYMSGTSQAAPHVAGVAAMVWSANNSLTGVEVKSIIKNNWSSNCTSCHMVDAERAVKAAFETKGHGHITDTDKGGVLCYVVEDGDSDKRIKEAEVEMVNVETAEYYKERTDDQGHFEIVVPEGKYSLFVTAELYEDYEWPEDVLTQDYIEVRKGEINYLDRDIGDWIKMKKADNTEIRLKISAFEADTIEKIKNKEMTIEIATPKLECGSPKQITGEKDGTATYSVLMDKRRDRIETVVTLHIDGYRDYVFNNFVLTQKSAAMEINALFEKALSSEIQNNNGSEEGNNNTDAGLAESETEIPETDVIEISEKTFPDKEFREYVSEEFDKNSDGKLSNREIDSVIEMDVHKLYSSNLKGIEYFTKLKKLDCHEVGLDSLDVSNNPELKELICNDNDLDSLMLEKNSALEVLDCSANGLSTLDVRNLSKLKDLNCSENQLVTLDVGQNLKLETLACEENHLNSLDISNNLSLTSLSCGDNSFGTLDISKNQNLKSLDYSNEDDKKKDNIFIDISQNPGLESLACRTNRLTSIDVSHNPKLKSLDCRDNLITSLDVTKNPELEVLRCGDNKLSELDLSKNSELKRLTCDNQWSTGLELDVSHNPLLELLNCGTDGLDSLDVSHNPELKELYCSFNSLDSVDVSKNLKLEVLSCGFNEITSVDVNINLELKELYTYGNSIKTLDVSHNTALTKLYCYEDELTSLDVSKNTALEDLLCHKNMLTDLDVSNNPALKNLRCHGNEIKTLDLCHNGKMKNLKVSPDTELKGDISRMRIEYVEKEDSDN